MLTRRNTPIQDLVLSLAIRLSSHVIINHLPVLRDKYQIRKQWKEIDDLREAAMTERHMWNEHFHNEHCRLLQELHIGNSVQIQNQDSPYLRQWTKTGKIRVTLGKWLYSVRVGKSNCMILCNRCFFHKIPPVIDNPHHSI